MKELINKNLEAMDKALKAAEQLEETCKQVSKDWGIEAQDIEKGDYTMEELIRRNNQAMDKALEAGKELHETARAIDRKYYEQPIVRVFNPYQAYLYLKNGCKMLDTYADLIEEHLVFVFDKESTKEAYKKWQNYSLN